MIHTEIAIVGGGLVGAAAAVALKKQGRDVSLLEIRPPATDINALTQSWDARIYAISPANQAWLQSLDAWPDSSRIQAVKKMDVRGDNGGNIVFNALDLKAERLTSIIENRWLLAALWKQINQLNIPVITQPAIALETDLSHATLTLENHETLQAKLIIGADGAQSWVRSQCDINVAETPYQHHGVVANFHTEKDHEGTAYQWFQNGEVLAYLPLPDKKISIVWSTAEPDRLKNMTLDNLATAVSAAGHHTLGQLSPLSPAFSFNLILRRPHSTVAQRVALIGDAAHTIHPLAGQGVNLGFGDVIELAQLAQKEHDLGSYQTLKRFAQNRLEPVRMMQWGCHGLFELFGSDLPGISQLRNNGLNIVNHISPLKTRLIRHAMGW